MKTYLVTSPYGNVWDRIKSVTASGALDIFARKNGHASWPACAEFLHIDVEYKVSESHIILFGR